VLVTTIVQLLQVSYLMSIPSVLALSVLESGVGVGAEVGGRVDTIVVAEVGVGVGCCRC
jgi:hypothetical protein